MAQKTASHKAEYAFNTKRAFMKFGEKFPEADTNGQYGLGMTKMLSEGHCSIYGDYTFWYDIDFMEYICSDICQVKRIEELEEAARPKIPFYGDK